MKKRLVQFLISHISAEYAQKTASLSLSSAVELIDRVIDMPRLLSNFNADNTVDYYTDSEWGYAVLHSDDDSIHMALNFDGVFDINGYYEQANFISELIDSSSASNVLELGCGKGFSSRALAMKYKNIKFSGIDLTPLHIEKARENAQGLSNLNYKLCDFNALSFPDNSFDVVFALECLCYSTDAGKTLAEAYRVLKPGGKLVVYDGYRRLPLHSHSSQQQAVTKLTEVGMAVADGFHLLQYWQESAVNAGFSIDVCEDLTYAIRPTLLRLQAISYKAIKTPLRVKILKLLFPLHLIYNAASGLLMPFTFKEDSTLGYFQIVYTKPK